MSKRVRRLPIILVTDSEQRMEEKMRDEHAKYKQKPRTNTFSQDMESRSREVDNEGSKLSELDSDIRVCTLNINKLTEDKVQFIAWFITKNEIDVLFIQDTQLSMATAQWRKQELKRELGEDVFISCSAMEDSQAFTNVGGQMVIVSSRWASDICDVDRTDSSNTGLVMAVWLKTRIGTLMIISNYWPYDSDMSGNGLAAGVTRWMAATGRKGSPREFVQSKIHSLIINQQSNSNNSTILCGDFNSSYHKDKFSTRSSVSEVAEVKKQRRM